MAKKNILLRSKIKKARALVQADQLAEAGVLLEQIVKTERRDVDVWLLLGVVNGKQGQHKQAAEYFSKQLPSSRVIPRSITISVLPCGIRVMSRRHWMPSVRS